MYKTRIEMEVLILLDVKNLDKKEIFEAYIKKEGFLVIEGEDYVYGGTSDTSAMQTQAYILATFKDALDFSEYESCSMVFLLDETPYPSYVYNKTSKEFEVEK